MIGAAGHRRDTAEPANRPRGRGVGAHAVPEFAVGVEAPCLDRVAGRLRRRAQGKARDRECEGNRVVVPREDQPDRAEHRSLADAVGGRIEERAERRRLAARPCEGAVEDVEH